ncbi:MAG: hypothetical protein OSA77_08085 [Halioglobus sp.]|jgi:hypothetical protein|nr:hypothetical protein [Halioglobus sp.]
MKYFSIAVLVLRFTPAGYSDASSSPPIAYARYGIILGAWQCGEESSRARVAYCVRRAGFPSARQAMGKDYPRQRGNTSYT